MQDVFVGLMAVAVGLLFCFRGYLALRVLFPIWGSFVGFMFGAGLISGAESSGFLSTALGWVVGFGFAMVFGLLAYLYYAASVIIGMGAIGFVLGTGFAAAVGVEWTWLVYVIGALAGGALAWLALATRLPMILLIVLTSSAGAIAAVSGLLLVIGVVDTADYSSSAAQQQPLDWWWSMTWLVLALVGVVAQSRAAVDRTASLRDEWERTRGRTTY